MIAALYVETGGVYYGLARRRPVGRGTRRETLRGAVAGRRAPALRSLVSPSEESRHTLRARNGANLGPWQVNVEAHPWADPWRLTHSWWYSARAARRISSGGWDWGQWPTASLCGL